MKELPRYQCFKIVRAVKIGRIEIQYDKSAILIPEDTAFDAFVVSADYVARARPKEGGYYVVYEDGYKSYSPRHAFESGYARMD